MYSYIHKETPTTSAKCKSAKNGNFDSFKQQIELKIILIASEDYSRKRGSCQTMGCLLGLSDYARRVSDVRTYYFSRIAL